MTLALRVDHLAVPVFDAEATYRFYAEVLRLPLLEAYSGDDWGGKPWLMMIFSLGDDRAIALCALDGLERPDEGSLPKDLRHFAFAAESKEERDAWKERLRRSNVEFWEEDHDVQQSIYFQDPNGLVLEITYPPTHAAIPKNPRAPELVKTWLQKSSRHSP